ncbi:MAG TPA: glycosyltransferase family 2 protein [Chitinophagaceae bacterium]
MSDKKTIFVVIPCYNEAGIIRETIAAIIEKDYSIIVVDDHSTDNTREQLKEIPLIYIRHRLNLGQGAALQTGISVALKRGAEYLVTFDADGQHDVNDIDGMLQKLKEDQLEIVLGSRFLPGSGGNISVGRKLLLKAACYLNYLFTGILLTDAHNGLRVMNRHAAKSIHLKENRMAHATEILKEIKKHDLKFGEFPVHIHYTGYSKKKGQSLLNSIRIFFDLVLNKIFD